MYYINENILRVILSTARKSSSQISKYLILFSASSGSDNIPSFNTHLEKDLLQSERKPAIFDVYGGHIACLGELPRPAHKPQAYVSL